MSVLSQGLFPSPPGAHLLPAHQGKLPLESICLPSAYSLSKGLAEPRGSREAPEGWVGLASTAPPKTAPTGIILHLMEAGAPKL